MSATEKNIITSPYRRGADFGFIFGIYLTVMFFSPVLAPYIPLLGLLPFLMMAGVPAVIFYFIRRYDRELQECATFPMMWMLGVVIFICGIMIAGSLLIIYMKWIEPDLIFEQISALAENGSKYPGTFMAEAGHIAQEMIDAHFIPSATAVVSELIMAAIVTGSMLSIVISSFFALLHKIRRHRRNSSGGMMQ